MSKLLPTFVKIIIMKNKKIMFYDSNYDKHFIPEEKGWYVQYKTESGDEGAEKLPREPLNVDDALLMKFIMKTFKYMKRTKLTDFMLKNLRWIGVFLCEQIY